MSTNYAFGDDDPVPVRRSGSGRRGGGRAAGHHGARSAAPTPVHASFRQGGHYSSAAARDAQRQSPQAAGHGWDAPHGPAAGAHHRGNTIDETGSLDYSASSSVQSTESSANSSTFADILKHIDIDLKDYSDPEIKAFMATQSRAASEGALVGPHARQGRKTGRGGNPPDRQAPATPAVAQYNQRVEGRSRQQQQQVQQKQTQQHHNYFKEDDFYDFGETVLGTIAGREAEDELHPSRRHSTSSSPSAASRGHTTPPPSLKHQRVSASPGASPISRTSSRHSKSSSDGSFETPRPPAPRYRCPRGGRGAGTPYGTSRR